MDTKEIAKERIETLFVEAGKTFKEDSKLSNNYIKKARKISMKFKIKIPSKFKRRYCKHCYSYLKPGVNVRIRNNKSRIVYYCLNCKKYMRFPLNERRKN